MFEFSLFRINPVTPMNTAQENKISMYLAVQAVCDKKQTVWQSLTAFVKAYGDFKTHVGTIQGFTKQQVRQKAGIAEDKKRLQVDMCNLAFSVAGAVKVYAVETKNKELAKRVSYSRTALTSGRDTVSADRCRDILAAATENIAKLTDYGVTSVKITAFQTAIDTYATALTKPRETRVAGKTITEALVTELKAVDEILKDRLDKLMPQLADKDPGFATDYTNARIIVDLPASRTSGSAPAKTTTASETVAAK
jgi:hypothetical protein